MLSGRIALSIRFADFEADLAAGELFRAGNRLVLQNIPFRILELLLRSGGEVVERERMMAEVWPDAHVGQRSINTAIRKLRHALGDTASNPQFIETVGSRGHRFKVPAEFVGESLPGALIHDPVTISIASFQNLDTSEHDSFCTGFTEELVVHFRRSADHISIILPPDSSADPSPRRSAFQAGRGFSAEYLLAGSVLSGTRNLRIIARLVRNRDRLCVWAESFSPRKGDILTVQDRISRQIVRAVVQALSIAR